MAHEVIAGRYQLERRLGGGATADVWLATDLELDRPVAVKLLDPQAERARVEREARAAAALSHPSICTLYSFGETDGRPFLVLEYLPGGSLEDRLVPGVPMPDDATARIAAEIAAGLAHAHRRGLVHRDLKPANVLFDAGGRAKIVDFGVARMAAERSLTQPGTVLGTAAYLSPEQAAGEAATPASDVYAFGVILFRMLTGRLPFEAADAIAVAAMHRDRPPPPVAALRPDAPARLESAATAALAKSPHDRPQDGAALLAELVGPARPAPAPVTETRLLPPRRRRSRALVAAVGALVLAVAGVALAAVLTRRDSGRRPATSTRTQSRPAPQSTAAAAPRASPPIPATPAAASGSSSSRRTSALLTDGASSTTDPATRTTTAPPTTLASTTPAHTATASAPG